eukprot:2036904-Pyramimonas_sp.AAC.1
MTSNPKYASIGPLAGELRTYSKHAKDIHKDGRGMMVSAEVLSRANSAADYGVETVAYTFFLFQVTDGRERRRKRRMR